MDLDLTRKSISGPFPRPDDLGFGQVQSVPQEDTRWEHPYGKRRKASSPERGRKAAGPLITSGAWETNRNAGTTLLWVINHPLSLIPESRVFCPHL